MRRDRRTNKLPESKAIAEEADAPSISGAATGIAKAKAGGTQEQQAYTQKFAHDFISFPMNLPPATGPQNQQAAGKQDHR